YALTVQYRNALTRYNSRQLLATASAYLPSIAPTHSIVLHGAWQETGVQDVRFANRFPYSRGYNAPYFARIYGLRSNYHFPIVYPDIGFGNILYIQRVRGNAFYDAAKVFDARKRPIDYQNSMGGEMFFDTKWWNQYELTFGIRVSHLINRDYFTGEVGATRFEFIMPVSIFPR